MTAAAMPPIVYGTAWKKERTAELVAMAIDAGFRGIDTACQPRHYHEVGVGDGLAGVLGPTLSRSDIYLQTKFSPLDAHDPAQIPYDPDAPIGEQVAQSFACSLENLRTEYVDGLVLHSPLVTAEATLEAWRALESIADAGGTQRLGISNCYSLRLLRALYDAARIRPAIVQNRFYAASGYDRGIRAFCREHRIVYQSFWTLTANPDLLASVALQQIAAAHGFTPAQTLFRYLSQQQVVPLTGTTNPLHMRQDLGIFERELDTGQLDAITGLLG